MLTHTSSEVGPVMGDWDPHLKGDSQTPIRCDLPLHQLAAINASKVVSKHNHKIYRGRLPELAPAQVNTGCCSTSKCIHSNNYLIICIRCQFPSLSGSAGSNPRVTSGVQAPSPSPFRSTVNEEEEEEDENEAHSRHQNEIRDRSPEEHEGVEDCEPSGTISSKPFTGRRRGGGSREQRSLVDYNSSGPSFAAVRGDNSSGPSFARGNNSI